MDWPRLAEAAFDALVLSLALGGALAPPDPFTQLLYAGPAFAVAVVAVYLYGQQSVEPWWKRYLVFVGGLLAVTLAWRLLAFAVGTSATAAVRSAFLLVGVAFGAWLAYFGGLERLRGDETAA